MWVLNIAYSIHRSCFIILCLFSYLLFWAATFSMGAFPFQLPLNKQRVKLLLSFLVAEALAKIQSNEILFFKRKSRHCAFEREYEDSEWRVRNSFFRNLSRNKKMLSVMLYQSDLILATVNSQHTSGHCHRFRYCLFTSKQCDQSCRICVQKLPSPPNEKP